mgnify:CR=1 FL=1
MKILQFTAALMLVCTGLGASSAYGQAEDSGTITARTTVQSDVEVVSEQAIDFGRVVVNTTKALDPLTGAVSNGGTASPILGGELRGVFKITAQPNVTYTINLDTPEVLESVNVEAGDQIPIDFDAPSAAEANQFNGIITATDPIGGTDLTGSAIANGDGIGGDFFKSDESGDISYNSAFGVDQVMTSEGVHYLVFGAEVDGTDAPGLEDGAFSGDITLTVSIKD